MICTLRGWVALQKFGGSGVRGFGVRGFVRNSKVRGSACALQLRPRMAKRYEEMDAWQLANELKLGVYRLSESGSVTRDFDFYRDLRDAAASGPNNIAEGSAHTGRGRSVNFSISRLDRSPRHPGIFAMVLIESTSRPTTSSRYCGSPRALAAPRSRGRRI